jgi:hypothetical protein
MSKKLAVEALGGNALLRDNQQGQSRSRKRIRPIHLKTLFFLSGRVMILFLLMAMDLRWPIF